MSGENDETGTSSENYLDVTYDTASKRTMIREFGT